MALGLWIGRRVHTSSGLIFSTILAANIGAGSTCAGVGDDLEFRDSAAVRGIMSLQRCVVLASRRVALTRTM